MISKIRQGGIKGKSLNYSEFLLDMDDDIVDAPTIKDGTPPGSLAHSDSTMYILYPNGWKEKNNDQTNISLHYESLLNALINKSLINEFYNEDLTYVGPYTFSYF